MPLKTVNSPTKLYLEAAIRLFFPSFCGACKSSLTLYETGVCENCEDKMRDLEYSHLSGMIDERFDYLDEAWCLFPYKSPIKELLTGIKFEGARWLIHLFKTPLKMRLLALHSENHYDALIPIPIDRQKRVSRQFNQSELFAKLISKEASLPVNTSVLSKAKRTPAQSQLNSVERKINLRGSFAAKRNLSGKRFLLIDDIITTGATAEEASRILKKNGAKKVDVLAIAYSRKVNDRLNC